MEEMKPESLLTVILRKLGVWETASAKQPPAVMEIGSPLGLAYFFHTPYYSPLVWLTVSVDFLPGSPLGNNPILNYQW